MFNNPPQFVYTPHHFKHNNFMLNSIDDDIMTIKWKISSYMREINILWLLLLKLKCCCWLQKLYKNIIFIERTSVPSSCVKYKIQLVISTKITGHRCHTECFDYFFKERIHKKHKVNLKLMWWCWENNWKSKRIKRFHE